jgi:hypothetical protein
VGGVIEPVVRSYIDRGRYTVPGWFERVDALLFAAIDWSQRAAGLSGDLMEIGAYMGRSAILLGYFRRDGERLLVCDPFGDRREVSEENAAEQDRWYGGVTRQVFERNFSRFHRRPSDEIIAAPSATLHQRKDELAKRFRIIHIDGSHTFEEVQHDIGVSRDLVAEGGMVVFDDVNARHIPGVAAAVWSAVVNDGLIPHVVTGKLYASWNPIPPLDLSLLSGGWRFVPHTVAGTTVLHPEEAVGTTQRLRRWMPPALISAVKRVNGHLRGR